MFRINIVGKVEKPSPYFVKKILIKLRKLKMNKYLSNLHFYLGIDFKKVKVMLQIT